MKLGSLTIVLLSLSVVAGVSMGVGVIVTGEREIALGALVFILITLVIFGIYRAFASSAHCPLCRGPVLSGSGAQRNRHARRTLGSHRLHVAQSILLHNSFVCPYCNEATRCDVKVKPKRPVRKKRNRSSSSAPGHY